MKRSYPMHYLFRSNFWDVKIMSLMPYMSNIMRILLHAIFYRKMNSMSIRTGNVGYIMTPKDHKYQYQKCDFSLVDIPLDFSCLTRNTKRDVRNI